MGTPETDLCMKESWYTTEIELPISGGKLDRLANGVGETGSP